MSFGHHFGNVVLHRASIFGCWQIWKTYFAYTLIPKSAENFPTSQEFSHTRFTVRNNALTFTNIPSSEIGCKKWYLYRNLLRCLFMAAQNDKVKRVEVSHVETTKVFSITMRCCFSYIPNHIPCTNVYEKWFQVELSLHIYSNSGMRVASKWMLAFILKWSSNNNNIVPSSN